MMYEGSMVKEIINSHQQHQNKLFTIALTDMDFNTAVSIKPWDEVKVNDSGYIDDNENIIPYI